MKYDAKCIMIGRKPRGSNVYKTAFVKIFDNDNPFSPDVLPKDELEFQNVKEVKIRDFELTYLLEGNDLFIQKVGSFTITENKKDNVLIISR